MEFNRDTITDDLANATCRQCGNAGAGMTFVFETGPHFARLDCKNCGRFMEWVSWPAATPRSDRRRSRRALRDLGERCELCLRHRDEIPPPGQLEVHHALEVAADEGSDDPANLRVYCSACHSHVNWLRTYFGHYSR